MRFAVLVCFSAILFCGPLSAARVDAQDGAPPVAEEDPNLDEAARLLFESASRSYDAGEFEDALARYQNAYELSGRAPLLYNIAICHDRLDHKEEAAEYYERFVQDVPDSPRVSVAASRAEILRASIARENARDGEVGEVEDEVDVAVDVAVEEDTPHPPPPSQPSRVGPIASFAIAGAGLVTFAAMAAVSSSRLSDAEGTCMGPGGCNIDELDDVDRASLIADIGLGVALAGAVVGTVWWIVGSKKARGADNAMLVAPVVSSDSASAVVQGRF